MLLKYRQLSNADIMLFDHKSSQSVIGLYFLNGVLLENDENLGISYMLDTLIYNMLCDVLPSTITITSNTNYAFSEFIIQCQKDEVHTVVETIKKLFTTFKITDSYFKSIKEIIVDRLANYQFTLNDQFDRDYYAHPRMQENIMGKSEIINKLNKESVQEWHHNYFCSSRIYFSICNPPKSFSMFQFPTNEDMAAFSKFPPPQRFLHRTKADIKFYHEQWEYSDIVISFDCPKLVYGQLLETELLCCMIELSTAKLNDQFDLTMDKPKISVDYELPRIIFSLTVPSNELKSFLRQLFQVFFSPLVGVYSKAKEAMIENYMDLEDNIYEFNKFSGWNRCVGNKYNIYDFQNGSIIARIQQIREDEVEKLRRIILNKNNLSMYAIKQNSSAV